MGKYYCYGSQHSYIEFELEEGVNTEDYLNKLNDFSLNTNPSDIGYWEFYTNGCELEPITRKGIYRRFLEYWEEIEGEE